MSKHINYFLTKEEQLIALEIQKNFLSQSNEIKSITQKEIHFINANLLLTDNTNVAYKVHQQLINSLISLFINAKFKKHSEELKSIFCFDKIPSIESVIENNIEEIPELIEELHVTFLNSEFVLSNGKLTRKKSKHYLKENGLSIH
jgi:adenine-specific DNA-methyltransferase